MKKMSFAFLFTLVLTYSSLIHPVLSPMSVFAADEKPGPHPGFVVVDLAIVRPIHLVFAAGALVLYPAALLLDTVMERDPEGLRQKWISEPLSLGVKRPLGDFTWSPE